MTLTRSTDHPGANRPSSNWTRARAHARGAAERQFAAFPLSRIKLPAIAGAHRDQPGVLCTGQCGAFGHGVHDATTEQARLEALFAVAPWATGYGIACGQPPFHLIGLDLDRKNGLDGVTALAALAERHGFAVPETATVDTPSGGVHLWLSAPTGVRISNSASKLGPGIDVRGSGGYLVGPGSLGSAGRYAFAPDADPSHIAPAPVALLALLAPPQAEPERRVPVPHGSGGSGRLAALEGVVLDAGEGELNNRLFWAACRAFEAGIDPHRVEQTLLDAAVSKGHPERGAMATIASARRNARTSR
ncbi:bifunctional DNA primase/polymerase [Kitasatospora sp. NBC_01302]|uniref:bifunctional DNA primase/polymerase n=1 Tax=Kitasatospora sp. NBC_01302 TaxID=2903575 RepID=UPI002E14AFE1|nr:bifunctional DNA primase/polymerase [Kitasatospora sp. NBC_01302]